MPSGGPWATPAGASRSCARCACRSTPRRSTRRSVRSRTRASSPASTTASGSAASWRASSSTAGPNPVSDRLARVIVEEQTGAAIARSTRSSSRVLQRRSRVRPRRSSRGSTAASVAAAVPSVGIEKSDPTVSAIPVFHHRGLATVDGVDGGTGQVALVFLLAGARPGSYGVDDDRRRRRPPRARRRRPRPRGDRAGLTVLVAARDEAERIGRTVAALREAFAEAEVVVADDGSRDGTAADA